MGVGEVETECEVEMVVNDAHGVADTVAGGKSGGGVEIAMAGLRGGEEFDCGRLEPGHMQAIPVWWDLIDVATFYGGDVETFW